MSENTLSTEILEAVVRDDVERIGAILDSGVDVNARNDLGETAFSFACAYNALAAAKLLHSRGADINSIDSGGGSPLDWAVCHSSPEFREWLVSVGGERHGSHAPWPWPPGTCGKG
jgi:ankyrin repeat protein